jgi:hypothetical protein
MDLSSEGINIKKYWIWIYYVKNSLKIKIFFILICYFLIVGY